MYVHLTTHSAFSLQEGLMTPANLVQAAKACGMSALGLTDHDLLTGAIEFAKACGARPHLAEYSPIPGTRAFFEAAAISRLDIRSEPLLHNNSIFYLLGGAEYALGNRKIERGVAFFYIGRSQIHGNHIFIEIHANLLKSRLYPHTAFANAGLGQAHQLKGRGAAARIDFHPNRAGFQTHERKGQRRRLHVRASMRSACQLNLSRFLVYFWWRRGGGRQKWGGGRHPCETFISNKLPLVHPTHGSVKSPG